MIWEGGNHGFLIIGEYVLGKTQTTHLNRSSGEQGGGGGGGGIKLSPCSLLEKNHAQESGECLFSVLLVVNVSKQVTFWSTKRVCVHPACTLYVKK